MTRERAGIERAGARRFSENWPESGAGTEQMPIGIMSV
jgi:hypothetical protein